MPRINPRFEVLYSDLKDHSLGEYLKSRDFKVFMTEGGYYTNWKLHYEKIVSGRASFSFGFDHEPGDATETFAIYLNAIETTQNSDVEEFVTIVICKFIESKQTKTDFSNVEQSMRIARFRSESLELIAKSIQKHQKNKFPESKPPIPPEVPKPIKTKQNKSEKSEVFIVHGHNDGIKEKVAKVIQKLKLTPVILNEQSDEGQTVIEKLEKHSNVSFAIILLTFDDFGNARKEEAKKKRARQNVILELGYFRQTWKEEYFLAL